MGVNNDLEVHLSTTKPVEVGQVWQWKECSDGCCNLEIKQVTGDRIRFSSEARFGSDAMLIENLLENFDLMVN